MVYNTSPITISLDAFSTSSYDATSPSIPTILSAYKAARQARFEHKETPIIGIPVDKPDPNKKIYYATSVTVMK